MVSRSVRMLGAALLLSALASACDATGCTRTQTKALDAAVLDLSKPLNSAVLEARLTAGGRALGGKTIEFTVGDDERVVGDAVTNSAGLARLDLKRQPTTIVDPTIKGRYRAIFRGDTTYCPSLDEGRFTLAKR